MNLSEKHPTMRNTKEVLLWIMQLLKKFDIPYQIAWTLFTKESRKSFRDVLKLDKDTWARGRGWALWKALCWAFPGRKEIDWRVVNEVLADHEKER